MLDYSELKCLQWLQEEKEERGNCGTWALGGWIGRRRGRGSLTKISLYNIKKFYINIWTYTSLIAYEEWQSEGVPRSNIWFEALISVAGAGTS